MSLEALALGLLSGLRPGTSLAALLVLLKTSEPRRLLLAFTVAGLAWTWAFGVLIVLALHGADVAFGSSTPTAVLDLVVGAALIGFGAGLLRGRVQPQRQRREDSVTARASRRLATHLRNPSVRVAAAAGVGTHLPGVIYLVALNAIAAEDPSLVSGAAQVATYDALWFMVPLASLVLVVVRPGAALGYVEAATAWAVGHENALLVTGSFLLGGYLMVKGAATLLT